MGKERKIISSRNYTKICLTSIGCKFWNNYEGNMKSTKKMQYNFTNFNLLHMWWANLFHLKYLIIYRQKSGKKKSKLDFSLALLWCIWHSAPHMKLPWRTRNNEIVRKIRCWQNLTVLSVRRWLVRSLAWVYKWWTRKKSFANIIVS